MAITLTPQQIYDRVWGHTLAKELGISDVGLGKLCARHDIPVPGRGYWAKKAAGKRVTQPKLPVVDDPYRQKIRFAGPVESTQPDQPTQEHPLIAFKRDPANRIVIRAPCGTFEFMRTF
jgi:hypothetical protein